MLPMESDAAPARHAPTQRSAALVAGCDRRCCSRSRSLLPAREARAWSTPTPFYTGAAREVFSIGGDPAGNAFAVIAGESLDKPLLLIERWAAAKEENDEFIWRGASRCPAASATSPTGSTRSTASRPPAPATASA